MKKTFLILGLFALSLLIFLIFFNNLSDAYSIKDGKIFYPTSRYKPLHNTTLLEETEEFSLFKVYYQSHGATIAALLRLPKKVNNPSTVIILPGSTVPKEARQALAQKMQQWGYATLTLDQRGNGEVPKKYSLEQQYAQFLKGEEIEEAQMVLDVLKGYDVLKALPVNQNRVVVLGESMGGKYALIAAALDEKIAGVLVISASGFGLSKMNTPQENAFLQLIDPDQYVAPISPRPVYFIHSPSDAVVPLEKAQNTFRQAGQPKEFYQVTCPHGYCQDMDPKIKEFLYEIFEQKKG